MIFVQAGLCAVLGSGLGLGLCSIIGQIASEAGYPFRMMWFTPLLGDGMVVLVSIVAAAIKAFQDSAQMFVRPRPELTMPPLNFTLATSFGNMFCPSRRRHVFCAPSTSLNTMASAVLFDKQPFERIVR
jgi:hypothetical protein